MILTRIECTWYNTNNSFGEIINKFQDCNIKKNILKERNFERKNKKTPKQQGFDFIQSGLFKYIYCYIVNHMQ